MGTSEKVENLKKQILKSQQSEGFIKVTDAPVSSLNSEQKVILNRKGNELFNQGNIEGARRIYTTTGYSDGLTRVGDKYMESNQSIKALKQYVLAHNKGKSEAIYEKMKDKKLFNSDKQKDWCCPSCGHTIKSEVAPEKCPLCMAKRETFSISLPKDLCIC